MGSSFYNNGENFDSIFFTDTQLIDRYIGNRAFGTGANLNGALADNTVVSKSSFVDFSGLGSTWKQVSAAVISTTTAFGAGTKTDGTLWTWGANSLGQLGGGATTASRSSPAQTANTTTDWARVATGTGFTAALKLDGSLWTWGFNGQGQLGTGNTANRSTAQVVLVSGSATNNSWIDVAASQYWGGTGHALALKIDGSLWAWGFNANGQLGDGTTINKSTPTQVGNSYDWYKIAAGGQSSAAIKTNGTLWTWGRNQITISSIPVGTGVLGDGTTTDRSSPGSVIGGGTNWKQVSINNASSSHMGAVKADGTLWTWGSNTSGRLGDGSSTPRSSPATVAGGGTNWDHISCGYGHTAAIKTDGSLWSWGVNSQGNLGTGNITARSSPETIVGGVAEWTAVSCSGSTDGAGASINSTLGIALFIGGG